MLFDSQVWPLIAGFFVFVAIQLAPLLLHRKRTPVETLLTPPIQPHPYPCWQVDKFGVVIWTNEAARRAGTPFLHASHTAHFNAPDDPVVQVQVPGSDGSDICDVFPHKITNGMYYSATPPRTNANIDVAEKDALRVLANTFSHLSTGLAIFNQDQRLGTFNPALIDLTGLDFETLSRGPDLLSFLDQLRDEGALGEPRNYADWRAKISKLADENTTENHVECWTQPNGGTLRLTVKPQGDGSITLLIEDVTLNTDAIRDLRDELFRVERMLDNSDVAQITF
ncbi:MAG: PAS-domain containing protein, partial [Pseudomonadota bacterium]